MTPVFADAARIPVRGSLVLRDGEAEKIALKARWGVLRHPVQGTVVIDTGYTPETLTAPGRSLALRLYSWAFGADLRPEGQPEAVLATMGLTPADVTRVIVTHFHPDHISGLRQFPNARFTASAATAARIAGRGRAANLRHGVFAELLPRDFMARLDDVAQTQPVPTLPGLPDGRDVLGDGTVITVDLPGHAEGHVGLFFPRPRPVLYAADTQWRLPALDEGRAPGFPATLIAANGVAAAQSTALVRRFREVGAEVVLCHDPAPTEFDL